MKKNIGIAWMIALFAILAGLPSSWTSVRAGNSAESNRRSITIESQRSDHSQPEKSKPVQTTTAAGSYGVDRLVVSSGGGSALPPTNTGMVLTINESAAGTSAGQSYGMELGFWYVMGACPISVTGDVQQSNDVNLTDVVYLVNYVLKAGPVPYPCAAAGDVNCSGDVNSTDIIFLVNFVLKAGPPPCDVCSLVPWTWSCP